MPCSLWVVSGCFVLLLVLALQASANTNTRFGPSQQTAILQGFCSASFWADSFWVIPGTILVEFEFCLKFRQNKLINLAGPSAKFDCSGILGIAHIPLDSSRNQWRTIKTSISVPCSEISPFLYNSNCSSTPWPNCKEVPETSYISSSPYCSAKSCQLCLRCCEAAILGVGC